VTHLCFEGGVNTGFFPFFGAFYAKTVNKLGFTLPFFLLGAPDILGAAPVLGPEGDALESRGIGLGGWIGESPGNVRDRWGRNG